MKKVVLFMLGFIIGIQVVNAKTTAEIASFSRCVDGDTAVFIINEEEIKFRFLAIDTPETVHPTQEVELYGKNASEYTCNRLSNAQEILVEYENNNKTDKYGRSLAWIWVDGELLQKELVRIGYAEVAYIYGDYRYTQSLCLVQKNAKELQKGMWSSKNEEGYCATIDVTNVDDNIIYDNIEAISDAEKEEVEKIEGALENIENITDKISKYTADNEELIKNVYFYLMIGAAILSILLKKTKK